MPFRDAATQRAYDHAYHERNKEVRNAARARRRLAAKLGVYEAQPLHRNDGTAFRWPGGVPGHPFDPRPNWPPVCGYCGKLKEHPTHTAWHNKPSNETP